MDEEAWQLARGFKDAIDQDTRDALNIQSSKKDDALNNLRYYVVPANWMHRAWPVLKGQPNESTSNSNIHWKSFLGKIECRTLLPSRGTGNVNDAVSDDDEYISNNVVDEDSEMMNISNDDEADNRVATTPQQNETATQQNQQPWLSVLRHGIEHEKDYFLLGPKAWKVVSNHFGCDVEIPRTCVYRQEMTSSGVATHLAVVIQPQAGTNGSTQQPIYITIPPTGHFGYDDRLGNNGDKKLGALNQPGNVSDDESVQGDDLFPGVESEDRTAEHGNIEAVLLLPPSTTPSLQTTEGMAMDEDEPPVGMGTPQPQVVGNGTTLVRRRYASGLGNMGNTCFMNSTIQCLAHTDPLRKYFLSGEYEKDLNRENPLGTGGELASEFAQLLREMWGVLSTTSNGTNRPSQSKLYSSESNVVFPRNFKYTLGRHAEQFVGYDQHDSQELATYLLDALHEDTNRVTKKPYVEKPEQAEDESDEEAANKAWALHLKREDSRVLEQLMGQVKSRVQCSEDGCRRVSTTFDPFMFFSVPIPGSSDRTLRVTFVPLNPMLRSQTIAVTLNKLSTISDLIRKTKEQAEKFNLVDAPLQIQDLCAADVFQKDIYSWYEGKSEIDRIRDNDETFVYQLRPLSEVKAMEEEFSKRESEDSVSLDIQRLRDETRPKRQNVDVGTLTRLKVENAWHDELNKYVMNTSGLSTAFHPKKGSTEARISIYKRLVNFIDQCYKELDNTTGVKRAREENGDDENNSSQSVPLPTEEAIKELVDRSDGHAFFKSVHRRYDLAVLEYISSAMRTEILKMDGEKKRSYPNGLCVEVRIRRSGLNASSKCTSLVSPLALRIPSSTTVYQLRQELAKRLARSLKKERGRSDPLSPTAGESSAEHTNVIGQPQDGQDNTFGTPEMLIMRQVPLGFTRRSTAGVRGNSSVVQMGSVQWSGNGSSFDGSRPIHLASPSDEQEKVVVADLVGDRGSIYLDWPRELSERYFDDKEYEMTEDPQANADNGTVTRTRKGNKTITVLDCIEKFCQMEQLEETEMWYCSSCKKHVRAWKQFYLYRSPPILIIHLKRFQYSSTTHRRDKINVFIDFPLKNLDLTEHVMHWKEEEKPIYDCYAVSNHYGGLGGGHYTAYVLHDDGDWCYYDDSRVTTNVDPKEVVSQAAYVLYYRRRDVPVAEDYVMHLHSSAVGNSPAVIQSDNGREVESDEVASDAALAGDEPMEVDEAASQATSPASDGANESLCVEHDYENGNGNVDALPAQ